MRAWGYKLIKRIKHDGYRALAKLEDAQHDCDTVDKPKSYQ